MMRRLAAGLAAAALGTAVLATASPAMAEPPGLGFDNYDGGSTRLSFDAGPEPIWKGRALSLEGKLSVQCEEDYIDGFVSVHHADYCKDQERWHWLGGKRITILFRSDRTGTWEYVESVRTNRGGYFSTQVPAYTSGTWRAVFEGARHLQPAEATDWVKVVGRH
ncbi:hypothetical protein OIE66_14915 [Nonomuraea sp. NBC_01738]|uniref:hypothetical protein n=1 Tax=Nonomuraea sp. NBC_01738 TaxID=2976003 RepID=UPI002E0DA8D6|nr:hypothetical protein OIE66_14915 [Nonomuraea sp. NBC_01738]